MAEFNSKNKYSFWHSPLMLIVLFVILILFIYNIVGLVQKQRETTRKKNIILSNIENLRVREKSLSEDINKLKTTEGVEETIRDKYQVVKEGEKMVVIVNEDKKDISIVEKESGHGFFNWIKNIFRK